MKPDRKYICIFLIILFHAVGLAGFLLPQLSPLFIKLVPWHLLLMLVLLVMSQPEKDRSFLYFSVAAYSAGFLIELIGIQTGWIFGDYSYGATLGLKLAGTPLMIGVNWIIVIYSAGVFLRKLWPGTRTLTAATGAALVTLLDWIIEPVAVRFDYWSWHNEAIPLQNYAAWFVFSFCLLLLFYRLPFKKDNPAGSVLLVVQFIFFLVLRLWGIN